MENLGKGNWYIQLEVKKKKYDDRFNLKGLKNQLKRSDKDSLIYLIQSSMVKAIEEHIKEALDVQD